MVNSRKIDDLHPKLLDLCKKHIDACRKRGVEMLVTNTLRDAAYQEYLYSLGRSKAGNIVTNMRLIGPHGFGLAYDVVPVVKGNALWNDNTKWKIIGEEGKKLGLTWGGNWKSIVDKPHFEYTGGLTASQLRAGKRPSWWEVKKEEPQITKTLKYGMNCEEVKVLQNKLNNLGYKLIADGDFGIITRGAVKDYQRSNGLIADGIVGPKTWRKIYEG